VLKIIFLHTFKKADQHQVSLSLPSRRDCVYKSLRHPPLL
jgi:hypothetical protein